MNNTEYNDNFMLPRRFDLKYVKITVVLIPKYKISYGIIAYIFIILLLKYLQLVEYAKIFILYK